MLVESQMVQLGSGVHDFHLRTSNPELDSIEGDFRQLSDYDQAKVLAIIFTCNHCPYAIHVEDEVNRIAGDYADRGVQIVAINSNNAETHPADSFERMVERAAEKSFSFPYLVDDSQDVAKAFGAECTPDVFVYDADRLLAYRGQIDSTRPRSGVEATGSDLRACLDALLAGERPATEQVPSIGCNIKWKDG